jgi:hypothetical protein
MTLNVTPLSARKHARRPPIPADDQNVKHARIVE